MRPVYGPILSTVAAQQRSGRIHNRPSILAAADPLRNVPRGDFTLADFDYERADLCQREFGNCELRNLGARA